MTSKATRGSTASRRWFRGLRASGIGIAVAFCVFAVTGLILDTVLKLDALDEASADNMQWNLAQLEVEFLLLQKALDDADDGSALSLAQVRRRYDVFYSRLRTVEQAPSFGPLRQDVEYDQTLNRIRGFLDDTAPLIDGPDDALLAERSAMASAVIELRPAVRSLSLSGLEQFAQRSEASREEMSHTLSRLALFAASLIAALSIVAYMNLRLSRVSERRAGQQRLLAERLETVINASLDPVIVIDTEGDIQVFNNAAERLFGYSADEAIGQSVADLIVPEKFRAAHQAGMKRYQQGGTPKMVGAGRIELQAVRKSGEQFPVEMSIDAASSENGMIFVSFLRDITDRKRAEADLVDARDRALAGEKAKAEFLAVMSHEMRTPLNGLLGTLSLLRDTELDERQQTYMDNMDASGKLLLHHVNDVLDIAKYEAGKVEIARVPFDLETLLSEIIEGQKSVAAAQANTLQYRWVGEPLEHVSGDPVRLRQVLLNLISNAIKFTRNGDVTLEIERLHSDGPAHDVEFRIIDTGIGIAAKDIDKVFGDFETLDTTFGRQAGGTGLGLGIARRLTQAMGGEIGVESTPGEGSLFWVRLPMGEAEPLETAPAPIARPVNGKGMDVLIVEDNRINRVVLREMLTRAGHRVTAAHDGFQGVRAAENHAFDVILMDISMPEIDGIEAARLIRSGQGASCKTPIIAVTAHARPEDIESFSAVGMVGHLSKPIMQSVLLDHLARVQEHSAQTTENAPTKDDPAPVPGPSSDLVDHPRVGELIDNLGREQAQRLFRAFEREIDEALHDLRPEALEAMSMGEIADLAHKLAGSCATVGARDLHGRLVRSETYARGASAQGVLREMAELPGAWQESRSALSELFRAGDDVPMP